MNILGGWISKNSTLPFNVITYMVRVRYISTALRAVAIIIVVYNEFLTYFLLPFLWPSPYQCASSSCVKILLVADPQILGKQASNRIERWDSDRYLSNTFSYAFAHTSPDIVIFLGDQMDEGHIAPDGQFKSDLNRFHSIFRVPDHLSTTVMYIPGDNDIGGEGGPIIPHSVHRFDKFFDQSIEPISYQENLEFYKINKMTALFQEPETLETDVIRIGLSHMPILRRIHSISKLVAARLKPQLILSGHDHDAVHISAPITNAWMKKIEPILPTKQNWNHYKLTNDSIHEFIVPTCSYRMGMLEMGYGFAQIDTGSRTVSFTVLWLPSRFTQLFVYLGFLTAASFIFLIYAVITVHHRLRRLINRLMGKGISYQPLLNP